MALDRRAWLVAMLVAGKLAGVAEAGDDDKAEDALAGPKVGEASLGPSLVSRDFRGDFQRLQEPAEEAALRLLRLSDAEQAGTQRVLNERSAILDEVVGNNLEILLRLQGFKEGGATPDRMAALREISEKLAPLRERGRLRDELMEELSPENAKEFRRLVDGYWNALIDSEVAKLRRESKGKDKPGQEKQAKDKHAASDDAMMQDDPAMREQGERDVAQADPRLRRQVIVRETLQAYGAELKRSFDRRIADGTAKLEDALAAINATPEQSDAIRNKVTTFYQETLGKPTPQQRSAFFRTLMKDLTPAQRRALAKHLYGGGAGAGAGADQGAK